MLRRTLAISFVLVAVLGPTLPASAQGRGDEVFGEFRDGLRAFDEGRYDSAITHFERVLALEPSHDQALRMRDEAGFQVWVEMMARDDDLGAIARHILRLAERARFQERMSETRIRGLVEDLRDAEIQEQWRIIEELVSTAGPFLVPHVVEYLGDRRNSEWRITVFQLLTRLGREGVLPMLEVLNSDDPFTRQNTCAILGHMGDLRAVPALRAITEDDDEEINVREEAARAITNITGQEPQSLPPAVESYLAVAAGYYLEEPSLMRSVFQDRAVWSWNDGRLDFRIVPDYVWNEEVAEEFCYDGLSVDPSFRPLWVLLANVHYAELAEIDEILTVAREKRDQGLLDEDEISEMSALLQRQETIEKLEPLTASAGREVLYPALERALRDRRPQVAVEIIQGIESLREQGDMLPSGDVQAIRGREDDDDGGGASPTPTPSPTSDDGSNGGPGDAPSSDDGHGSDGGGDGGQDEDDEDSGDRRISGEPGSGPYRALLQAGGSGQVDGSPLLAALRDQDKRVRYQAAITLANLNPTSSFGNMGAVVQNLADAVGESGSRVILVVHEDENVRNRLVSMLEDQGYTAFSSGSGRQGLLRARAFPAEDAVLCSTTLPRLGLRDRRPLPGDEQGANAPEPFVVEFINELRADYRTGHVPVLALAPDADADRVSDLIRSDAVPGRQDIDPVLSPDIDRSILGARLEQLFTGQQYTRDAAARSTDIARRAAEALAGLEPGRTALQLEVDSLRTSLLQAVESQPDVVRIPCMRALGKLQAPQALDRLYQVFANEQNSRNARVAATWAMGEIWKGGAPISEAAFDRLTAALEEGDVEIYEAAAHALGKASLTDEQRLQVFRAQRAE